MPEAITIHFETSTTARPSKTLTPELVEEALARYPGLRQQLRLTFNSDEHQTDAYLSEASIVMIAGQVPLQDLARRAPRLKWLQLSSAGVDQALKHVSPDIMLTNASGVHAQRTHEIVLMALLMMNNHMPFFFHNQMRREWAQRLSEPIAGKTVVILGLGGLGAASALAARQIGLKVLGLSRRGEPRENVDEVYRTDRLKECFARADFVIVTLPLTEHTRNCIDAEVLDCLPAHAQLLNIGRAQVIDYEHLAKKLEAGELAGAMLDVFEEEPLPTDSVLWSVRNLIVTPHCWLDRPNDYARLAIEAFAEDLDNFVKGRPLLRLVDREQGY